MIHTMPSMKKASYEIALKSKRQIAKGTMLFVFEKPKGFAFKAGQHVRMTLLNPPETDTKGDSRFFSLVNTPQEKDLVIALRMSDSASKRVLKNMNVGEKVLIQILLNAPHDSFAIHDDASIPAVFLIGGIGIVPAFSMIKDAIERKLSHKIFLFYSNRKPEDAPFLNELEQLAKQNPNFSLIATMTEAEKSVKPWRGETGYINKQMLQRYLKDLNAPVYYIAGLSGMVNAMKGLLNELKVDKDNIHAEDFSNFKMSMINLTNNPKRNMNHLLIAVIGIVATIVLVLHVGAAFSLFKSGGISALLSNPITYVMIVLMILIIPFKFKHITSLIQRKGVKYE